MTLRGPDSSFFRTPMFEVCQPPGEAADMAYCSYASDCQHYTMPSCAWNEVCRDGVALSEHPECVNELAQKALRRKA